MKTKYILLFIALALVGELIVSPLRVSFSMSLAAVGGFAIFFQLTIFGCNKFQKVAGVKTVVIGVLIGILILQLPARLYDFQQSRISLLEGICHIFGVFAGLIYVVSKKALTRSIIVFIAFLFNLFIFTKGYDLWMNKINYGTFSGKINIQKDFDIHGFDESHKRVTLKNGKYIVLDFWFSSCGACFIEFPRFEELYKKYKSRKDMIFFAVNTPMPTDTLGVTSFRMIKEREYSFPVLQASDNKEAKKLAITVYPTSFLMDKKGSIIYKGDLKGLAKLLENL